MSRRGFSLVELVMVVVIVGIAAAIAVPRYAGALSRYRAEAAATRLVADLRLAIARAEAGSASYVVTADATHDTLSIAGPLPAVSVVSRTDFNASPYLADLAVDNAGGQSVTIDGYGRPDRAITFTVISGDNKRIVTLTATGEVTTP